MKYLICCIIIILICQLSRAQKTDIDSINKMLQGEWISSEDSNSMIVFVNDTIKEFYQGMEDDTDYDTYRITNTPCHSFGELTSRKSYYYIRRYNPKLKDSLCYSIDFIDEKILDMVYEGSRVLIFRKKR